MVGDSRAFGFYTEGTESTEDHRDGNRKWEIEKGAGDFWWFGAWL
jgi:hypothetical protein